MAKKRVSDERSQMAKKRKTLDIDAEDRTNDLYKAFDIAAEDRISNLPDEILSSIVLVLPSEDAASTCLLSKRWQNIWLKTMAFCKDFNINFNTCYFEPLATSCPYTTSAQFRQLEDEGCYNVDYVDKLIENHKGSSIDQFRVFFNLDYSFREHINEWIKFAMRKKAKILKLNFQFGYNGKRRYNFPKTFLHIKRIGFESFRVVELKYVNVVGEILEHLLSHCPVLERLTVHHSGTLKNLRVVGSSPMFKYLDLKFCRQLRRVEIRDSNLVSFSFSQQVCIDIVVENAPKLVEVSFPSLYCISKLSDCLSQLQNIKISSFDV